MRIIILTLNIFWSVNSFSAECYQEKSFKLIKEHILQIQNLINGTNSESSIFSFFGQGFDIKDTYEISKQLEEQLAHRNGVSAENGPLYNCLESQNQIENASELIKLSKELVYLKLNLLKKNKQFNNAFVSKSNGQRQLPDIKKNIDKEIADSEREKKILANEVLEVESSANIIDDLNLKELSFYKSELTKLKIDLINKKIEHNKILEKKLKYFEEQSFFLSKVLIDLDHLDYTGVLDRFKTTEKYWKEISSRNYNIFRIGDSFDLPNIPNKVFSIELQKGLKKQITEVNLLREELVYLKRDTLKELMIKKNHEIKLQNDLLLQVNNARNIMYQRVDKDYIFKQVFQFDYYKKLLLELKASPFRVLSYFYSKFLYLREEVSKGKPGFKQLGHDLFFILILIFILVIIRTTFVKIKTWIDQNFVNNKFGPRSLLTHKLYGLWNKFKDNFEEILWLCLVFVFKKQSLFSELRILVDIFQVFLISRILKSVVIMFFGSISLINIKNFTIFKTKAQLAAKYFTNIYLFYTLSLILVDATIGRTYIFSIVKIAIFCYTIFRVLSTAVDWIDEFWTYIERNFSGFIVSRLEGIFKFLPQKFRATIYFFLIIIFSILNLIIRATENFEISKKISANIFKKQIENVEADNSSDKSIPAEYLKAFHLSSIEDEKDYVCVNENFEDKIICEIREWNSGESEEHSLVVYGDKGVGKTTLMKHCLDSFSSENNEDTNTIKVKLPAKINDKKALQGFLHKQLLNIELEGDFDLYQIDNLLEKKTILFIDEAQNIFLSHVGGFEAYEYLLNLINFNTKKIFWVMSFNKYSWLYLDRAFGRNQFFRNVYEIKGWSDSKIKELIMSRHNKTKFKLSFDLLINATRSQDEIDRYASVESKFYKLLWELSRGNPRSAISLWTSALSRKNMNTFNVHVPREVDLSGIEKFSDDLMFVLAHVIKHENLTSREIEQVTNLPNGIVRNSIKVGLEKGFLFRDSRHRYMVDISSQYGVIKFLTLKNFIYGS